ncbi:MAG: sensor histidine kinase [Planctomycetota bacterium]
METNASKSWLTWRFFGVSVLFWTVMTAISTGINLEVQDVVWTDQLALQALGVLCYSACTVVLFECSRRFSRRQGSWLAFAAKLTGVSLLVSLTHQLIYTTALTVIFPDTPWAFGFWTAIYFFRHCALAGVAAATEIYRSREAARGELLQAQLRALRNQLQPHFLFNSLQGISASVRSEPDTAVRMITLLGDLLRQTLRERSGQLVTLADEHHLLEPYLELQRLRFADRLTVEIDLPDDVLSAAVPDLILQPLVENALLHGIEKQPGEGSVRISARRHGDRLELKVADDGGGPAAGPIADGVGLGTTRSRLRALFGERAQLTLAAGDLRGTVATVSLPFEEARDAA